MDKMKLHREAIEILLTIEYAKNKLKSNSEGLELANKLGFPDMKKSMEHKILITSMAIERLESRYNNHMKKFV